ncbi:unnamed protein product [Ilex paraguariensis]|uniref:non-specific serine/threonine protein kinase n=1 Tax=Ilex paraguariensis TaxID=185542 RepID=A0ABC8S6L3_9AQUA
MHQPSASPSFLHFLLTISLISIQIPTILCGNELRYVNCSEDFSCGSIKGIKYPFWGANRADYCGNPGFELECLDSVPLITMVTEKYRILDINLQRRGLVVARDDYWNDICPVHLVNTTLDFSLFSYSFGLRNLTLFYGCTYVSGPILGQYDCGINSTNTNLFYVTKNLTTEPPLRMTCNNTVILPVFEGTALALETNRTGLGAAIDGGFELQWNVDNSEQCSTCVKSGGECGYNKTDNQFTCFCHDQSYPSACLTRPDNQEYAACDNLFQCANISNLGYPFSGQTRPSYCGHPGFQLNCQGSVPLITILSMDYRVLAIDNQTQTLTVAREDMWNNNCPTLLYNTTMDFTIFKYASNQQNVSLHYECTGLPGQTPSLPNQFDCPGNGTTSSISYFVMGDTSNSNINLVTCNSSVLVPVNPVSTLALSSPSASMINLRAALAGGFQLQWDANDTNCKQCIQSRGLCGSSNSDSTSFACYCADGPYPLTCNNTQPGTGRCGGKWASAEKRLKKDGLTYFLA